jgi:hypothetical protein
VLLFIELRKENGFHNHMDARSSHCMDVIMDYDMVDHGSYNPDRRRENQERGTRHTSPSQKKNVQTTKQPPEESFVTSSTVCQRIGWNRNKRSTTLLWVYYYGPYKTQSFV